MAEEHLAQPSTLCYNEGVISRALRWLLPCILLAGTAVAVPAQAQVHHVNHAATGANTGASWTDAFLHPSQALAVATDGDQIWVAQGTYLASRTNVATESFLFNSAVELLGGFDGTELAASQRDPEAHTTTLSGELPTVPTRHVVMVDFGGTEIAWIDGFTIRGGNTPDSGGGGMHIKRGEIVLSRCTFLDNKARWTGGAVHVEPATYSLKVRACHFERNSAEELGGAIWIQMGALEITDSEFVENSVLHGSWSLGGAIWTSSNDLSIQDCRFLRNECVGGAGGAIYSDAISTSSLKNVWFEGNSAASGGAIHATTPTRIEHCTFLDNRASYEGGAMFSSGGRTSLSFLQCYFVGNRTTQPGSRGGALCFEGTNIRLGGGASIDRCEFVENTAGTGGAIYFEFWRLWLTNSVLSGNVADVGSAFFVDVPASAESLIMNCTIVGNVSRTTSGAGVLHTNASFPSNQTRVLNSIFWANEGPGGAQTEWDQLNAGGPRVSYCCIQNHALRAGAAIRSVPPRFRNPASGDFRLLPSSPLIDVGDPLSGRVMPRGHVRDFEGQSRIIGPYVDIGADEMR